MPSVVVGSRTIALVKPIRDVNIPSRQSGGKYEIKGKGRRVVAVKFLSKTAWAGCCQLFEIELYDKTGTNVLRGTKVSSIDSFYTGLSAWGVPQSVTDGYVPGNGGTMYPGSNGGWASNTNSIQHWWQGTLNTPAYIDDLTYMRYFGGSQSSATFFPTSLDILFQFEGDTDFTVMNSMAGLTQANGYLQWVQCWAFGQGPTS